jgi:pyruvate formate-lyase activating enzyme-like uncharacterized protein
LTTGLEIPAVVDGKGEGDSNSSGLGSLVDYAVREDLSFVNINELEASHTNMELFKKKGFELVGDSMAVKGSRDLALDVMKNIEAKYPLRKTVLHLCSSVYKDSIQLRHRLKRMAENLHKPYELVTDDGTLIRGIIETPDAEEQIKMFREEFSIPENLISFDGSRIFVAPWVLEEIAPDIDQKCYLSEVYPTWDGLEVERIPL